MKPDPDLTTFDAIMDWLTFAGIVVFCIYWLLA